MRVLVTGADGFAGSWLARELLHAGHSVTGTTVHEGTPEAPLLSRPEHAAIEWRRMQLASTDSVTAALRGQPWDGVVHLAAIAWSRDAAENPELTQDINVAGAARVLEAVAELRTGGHADPTVILASSAEVYGRGHDQQLRSEQDPVAPLSPYAESKLEAERAATRIGARTGLKAIVVRLFPHIGPGQRGVFVVPALLARLRVARLAGATEVPSGSLSPVRDFLDVRDVARAYRLLLESGVEPGVYNVASGIGRSLQEIFDQLTRILGVDIRARPEAGLSRPWDLPHLVGDPAKLRRATGWSPRIPLEQTLTDLVHAEAH